jgi:hypothetical protein
LSARSLAMGLPVTIYIYTFLLQILYYFECMTP